MKMETKKAKHVLAGKAKHVISTDPNRDPSRRHVLMPSMAIPRPTLVRRGSIDNSTLTRAKGMTLLRTNSMTSAEILERKNSLTTIFIREPTTRKQSAPPSATKLSATALPSTKTSPPSPGSTGSSEIKSILKSGNGKYALKEIDSKENAESECTSSDGRSIDSRFCYRLPEKSSSKFRKSVSFIEDKKYSSHSACSRQYSSPILSLKAGSYRLGQRERSLSNF